MQLPSKIIPYEESVLSLFPPILRRLEIAAISVNGLYQSVKKEIDNVEDFLLALDCLYALGKIDYHEGERMLFYVGDAG